MHHYSNYYNGHKRLLIITTLPYTIATLPYTIATLSYTIATTIATLPMTHDHSPFIVKRKLNVL